MRLEARKYLEDILRALQLLAQFARGRRDDDYARNALLRSAVERQFEIIGEALARLARVEPGVVHEIREHRRIIAFRNILIDGYTDVDDRLVWDSLETNMDQLEEDVAKLLADASNAD